MTFPPLTHTDLCLFLQSARLLHLLQHLLSLIHVPLAAQLLRTRQQLPDLLVQLVHTLRLKGRVVKTGRLILRVREGDQMIMKN